MNSEDQLILVLSTIPLFAYGLIFRRSWADQQLWLAGISGLVAGALATFLVRFLAYPIVSVLLGISIRTLIMGASGIFVKAIACMGVIGPIEETAKLLMVMLGVWYLGMQNRPAAVFLAAVGAGVGFSLIENLDYYELYGSGVLALRGIVSSTGHAIFSGLAGLAAAHAFLAARSKTRRQVFQGFLVILGGLGLASIFHGLFNLVAFELSSDIATSTLILSLLFGITVMNALWIRTLVLDVPVAPTYWHCQRCEIRNFGTERFCMVCGTRVLQETRGSS